MKYVFGINLTEDKNNKIIDGQVFHSSSISPELLEEINKCGDISAKHEKKISLPIWMAIVQLLSLVIGSMILISIINGFKNHTLREIYNNAPSLFYISIVSFTIYFILYLIERNKKKYLSSDEYNYDKIYTRNVFNYTKNALDIPDDAKVIEVLLFYYKVKNGKMRVVEKTNHVDKGFVSYQNFQVYAYVKKETLYMRDLYDEWAIPLYCITGIKKINKKISVPRWNKEIPYNKGIYKKYKMIINGLGYIFFKPYYAVSIAWNGENYELLIPPYELDILSALIGIDLRLTT